MPAGQSSTDARQRNKQVISKTRPKIITNLVACCGGAKRVLHRLKFYLMLITSTDVDQGANGSERCNQSSYQLQFIRDKLKEVKPLRM